MNTLAQLDHRYIWHPFTQMKDWLRQEPIIIASAKGAVLKDTNGREYLDANSSIWTNLHGHCHPTINVAIEKQLKQIAHSSGLGLGNVPASILARDLIKAADLRSSAKSPQPKLEKVFYSDDGSTAVEAALKIGYEFARRSGLSSKPRFLSLSGAYHGDTIGAVSLGHIDLFHSRFKGLLFRADQTPAPYCYRCPHNKAVPQRADARTYRQCGMECLGVLKKRVARRLEVSKQPYAGFVFEPVIQGAAGMIAQPEGWMSEAASIARVNGTLLIADEVMTGFGRTGPLFGCHKERFQPDLMALAKGMSGGYLPMAATLATRPLFEVFLGEYEEFKTFFHGHSYNANQLGSVASMASLGLLNGKHDHTKRQSLADTMRSQLQALWEIPQVGDIRQEGTICGIELVQDWKTKKPFPLKQRMGIQLCEKMARRGILTRPIGNAIVFMPPYCTTSSQVKQFVLAFKEAARDLFSA